MEIFVKSYPTLTSLQSTKDMLNGASTSAPLAPTFQSVLDEEALNEQGQALGWVKRKHLVTPFRMGLSVRASRAT